MDFSQYAGKHYLIVVDRSSGYVMVAATPDQTTETALRYLRLLGNTYGFPSEVHSDRGPAFRSKFEEEVRKLGINHHTSPLIAQHQMGSQREGWE